MNTSYALLAELVHKNLKIRYGRPAMAFFWGLCAPALLIAVLYVVFSLFLQIRIAEAPFLLYLASALFPWRFFSDSLIMACTSLVDNKNLVREARVAHYLIPVSVVVTEFILLVPGILITAATAGLMLGGFSPLVLSLPLVLLLHLVLTAALAVICSIGYVCWRNSRQGIEIALQLLFYATPVFYSLSLVKALFHPAAYACYVINPLVGMLMLYRSALLKGFDVAGSGTFEAVSFVLMPVLFTVFAAAFAVGIYARHKRTINDRLSY